MVKMVNFVLCVFYHHHNKMQRKKETQGTMEAFRSLHEVDNAPGIFFCVPPRWSAADTHPMCRWSLPPDGPGLGRLRDPPHQPCGKSPSRKHKVRGGFLPPPLNSRPLTYSHSHTLTSWEFCPLPYPCYVWRML